MRNNANGVWKLVFVSVGLFIVLHATSAVAAAPSSLGFWAGLGDGFLSLVKLLANLIVNVQLFDREARNLSYDVGFFLGVLGFAGLAGALDSGLETER